MERRSIRATTHYDHDEELESHVMVLDSCWYASRDVNRFMVGERVSTVQRDMDERGEELDGRIRILSIHVHILHNVNSGRIIISSPLCVIDRRVTPLLHQLHAGRSLHHQRLELATRAQTWPTRPS